MCLREKKNSIAVNNKISLSFSFFGNEVTWSSIPEPRQWVQGLDTPMPAMMIAQKLSKTKNKEVHTKGFGPNKGFFSNRQSVKNRRYLTA